MLVVPVLQRGIVSRVWTRPTGNFLPAGAVMDLCRSKQELVVENALLRQQLIVLRRQVTRRQLTNTDRAILVLLASRLRSWKSALLIVQPDTLLRSLPLRCGNPGHRVGFRVFWRHKSKATSRGRRHPVETVNLIKQMAQENRLWGAERIRGELLKLNIRVCKRTIQKYMRQAHRPSPSERKPNQNWGTFLHNHAQQVWACDFLPVYDLFFRPLFILVIIELGSRRVVHFGVTRSPTDEWTAQQVREATPWGETPRFLIRDNDSKYGASFARVAEVSGIETLKTPHTAPKANAFCERFLGSVRRECLDHILILSEKHLHRVIKEFVEYYNCARPHQGIGQAIPHGVLAPPSVQQTPLGTGGAGGKVISFPVLGGLHHDYRRVA